jgi:catechol 2,3-dioxygenase-like lactoylglutathione lyase family enzyme
MGPPGRDEEDAVIAASHCRRMRGTLVFWSGSRAAPSHEGIAWTMQWYAQRFAVRPGGAVAQCPRRCCFHAGINAKDCVVTCRVFTLRFHILWFHIPEAVNGEPVVNASQEPDMSNIPMRSERAVETLDAGAFDMKLEIVVIPVSDVDRAKRFYGELGWRLDLDFKAGDDYRVIQYTPPGSACSVMFGTNVTAAAPGSVQALHLVVSDIVAARNELLRRGIEISEPFHDTGGVFHHADGKGVVSGLNPQRQSYASYASFSDPDGNDWVLQEITVRLSADIEVGDTRFTDEVVKAIHATTVG